MTHPHPKRNFVPATVSTKSGQALVNTAKQSSHRATISVSTARHVNTVAQRPNVNDVLSPTYFKAHSSIRRRFNQKSTAKTNNFNEKVNTAKENVVKSSACWIWRPIGNIIDHNSKDSGSYMLKRFDYVDLQGRLNGCSRHMTGNKSFLTYYQDIDGGFVAFAESPKGGKITGKDHQNKTPYELLIGRPPKLDFMRPFGCPVTILNTLDHLGKFEGKADDGFLVGYSINITTGNQTNDNAGIEANVNAGQAGQEKASDHKYILLPFMLSNSPLSSNTQNSDDKDDDDVPGKRDEGVNNASGSDDQERTDSSTQNINTTRPSINTVSLNINTGSLNINIVSPNDSSMPSLEEISIFGGAYDDEDVGAEADLNNLETTMNVSPIPTTRIHKDHHIE
ncbi:hypothetical protein Tco_1530436 [Tanacetum coccineum]